NSREIASLGCDLVLLDSLSTSGSLGLVEELRAQARGTRIVLFGMDEDEECFLKAVHLGIRGYLLKDASSAEVVAAVQGVMRGEAVCPPKFCAVLFEFVSKELHRKSVLADSRTYAGLGLTYRQRELMLLVAEGLTNKEIAASLNLSEFTVRNHISRVMKQVEADSRHAAVEVIRSSSALSLH
ncbi:MAG TPA: response regulator transcription factor, partial [Nitrospirota bacterium]